MDAVNKTKLPARTEGPAYFAGPKIHQAEKKVLLESNDKATVLAKKVEETRKREGSPKRGKE